MIIKEIEYRAAIKSKITFCTCIFHSKFFSSDLLSASIFSVSPPQVYYWNISSYIKVCLAPFFFFQLDLCCLFIKGNNTTLLLL